MEPLRFRQIHLDFHTSEMITGIGKDFDKIQFQETLKAGHVNSITVFSKCHHGWAYHPTTSNKMHPHLNYDLLGRMIEAAHEIDVKTPVYLSAGLDEKIAREHPEWLYRNRDESTTWVPDFQSPGYHLFCFNNPYLDILLNQIEEVVLNYEADGIFLDIVKPKPCYCQNCVKTLRDEGKDPYNEANAIELGERLYAHYTTRVRAVIDKHKPGLPVFHNGGHIPKGRKDLANMNSHLELESLPTGGWGYDHFPLSARYALTTGLDYLGMTGKFHTSWGEFGGFKHPSALKYETSLSLANGAKCSIGDQLHPFGQLDPLTYKIIGEAYRDVEVKEPWCAHVTSITDVAILSFEALNSHKPTSQDTIYPMDIGANRMLMQNHILYDIVDADADFTGYKVLILPDSIRLDAALTAKIKDYMASGGKLLVTGESGLSLDKNEFVLELGVAWESKSTNRPNYFKPIFETPLFTGSSFICYSESEHVSLTTGNVLGHMESSFFNREVFQFCSHQHTPNSHDLVGPGMVETKNSIYIPWKIFTDYAQTASMPQRDFITYALNKLLGDDKTLNTNLPSQGIVTLMNQAVHKRQVLHLLYASPVLRGNSSFTNKPIEMIEDLIPIHNTKIELKLPSSPNKVYLAPQMEDLDYHYHDGKLTFNLQTFTCHQMIVIE